MVVYWSGSIVEMLCFRKLISPLKIRVLSERRQPDPSISGDTSVVGLPAAKKFLDFAGNKLEPRGACLFAVLWAFFEGVLEKTGVL
jgi:hypothetical protein